jgi:3-oxoacyl-[acyl-carrier protein] reductase
MSALACTDASTRGNLKILPQYTAIRELEGKIAVVTGSSQGIGRAIALELASAGANVLIHAGTHVERASSVAVQARALNVEASYLVGDISDRQACAQLVNEAFAWRDSVDIWINNAGADVLTGAARDWDWETKLDRLWKVDVAGAMRLSREVGKRMTSAAAESTTRRRDFCILNMGWDQAQFGMGGESGEMFSAIKGAVMAFTRSLAISLAPHVRVNCLAPGWIKTSWGETAPDYWRERATGESLLARWGEPEDVAKSARFLCSPSGAFINGQILPINGGFRHGR